MKQQKKLRILEFSSISLLLIATLLTIFVGLKAENLLTEANKTWQRYIEDVEVKEKALTEIQKSFGYGGFIHHFKNYVIRQNDDYLSKLNQSQQQLFKAINVYQTLPLNDEERTAITELLGVLDRYIKNIPIAIQAKKEGWSQNKTDRLVAIDDTPAFDALIVLEHHWQTQYQNDLLKLEQSYHKGISLAGVGLLSEALLIFVIVLSIWFIYRLTTEVRKRRDNECRLYLSEAAIEASTNGVSITDDNGDIVFVNPAFEKITGYRAEEVIGKNPRILSSGRHDESFFKLMWKKIKHEGKWSGEVWNRQKNGELYLEWIDIIKFPHTLFNHGRYLAVFSDITSRKKEESIKAFQATHDPLTKLPNRNLFFDRLDNALLNCSRMQTQVVMLFIDLDKFKPVNDHYGHLAGDQLLIDTSKRIVDSIRQTDSVCRYGGDEFIVILTGVHSENDWTRVVDNLLARIREPFIIDEHELKLSASIGVAIHSYKDDLISVEQFIRKADEAMYVAKQAATGRYSLAK